MRTKKYSTTSVIANYVEGLLNTEQDTDLCLVLEQARKYGTPPLQITSLDARHLSVLVKAMQARRVVEIGTLCGYSAVVMAKAMDRTGKIWTLERSAHHAKVARSVFHELKLEHCIELVFGEALENLPSLGEKGPFDIVFIDANKENYPEYFEWAMENLRQGGLLIADNVFTFGHIADDPLPEGQLGQYVSIMRNFNKKCAEDKRLLTTFFPTGEGLLVAVRL